MKLLVLGAGLVTLLILLAPARAASTQDRSRGKTPAAGAVLGDRGLSQRERGGLIRTSLISRKPRHSRRFLVAQRLNRGLVGTPLAHYGFVFEREGWKWNVSPFLVASIAGTESSFGATACGGNAWGIASCGVTFASFSEGIRYTTRLLRLHYINEGLHDVWAIGARYAACGRCWGNHTAFFMLHNFGASPTVVTYR